MRLITAFALATASALVAAVPNQPAYPAYSQKHKVHVRPPPTLVNDPQASDWNPTPANWKYPPKDFMYTHTWHGHTTSLEHYKMMWNLQWNPRRALPGLPFINTTVATTAQTTWKTHYRQLSDLTSFNPPFNPNATDDSMNNLIITAFGYDFFQTNDHTLLNYRMTGALSPVNNYLELMAWGFDRSGHIYIMIYETAVAATRASAGLDIFSTHKDGPDDETVKELWDGVRSLGIAELLPMVDGQFPFPTDTRRDRLPAARCEDERCLQNMDLPPIPTQA